jgi:hypothetical protein
MKKKQTAVDWLIEKVEEQREDVEVCLKTILYQCYEAKQMEKEQINNFIDFINERHFNRFTLSKDEAEQYYNETYGG